MKSLALYRERPGEIPFPPGIREARHLLNAIREAEHNLLFSDLRASAVEHLLEPMRALVEDEQFWRHPGDGLVILRSAHVFRVYRLPIQVIDRVVVSNHFMLKPLLPLPRCRA